MIEAEILKQLSIILISALKFFIAPPTSYLFGYSYVHTILNTTIGGWIGIQVFYHGGKTIFPGVRNYLNLLTKGKFFNNRPTGAATVHGRVFKRRNRFIVKIRNKYGLPGLIILTPVLFSIPIGTLLIVKYYSQRKGMIAWLSLSVMAWSVVMSTFLKLL